MNAATSLVEQLGATAACAGLGVARATYYRSIQTKFPLHTVRRPRRSPLALTTQEREHVLDVLHSPEYVDVAPHTAYAMLLDAGHYLASVSTFYRILREASGTRPRRNQLVHPSYARPELLATKPCEVWSWENKRSAVSRPAGARGYPATSRNSKVRSSPPISTCTSSSTFSAATWWAG